jgi:hypothetical protein
MALQIRRGTESDRLTQIANFKAGEVIYTTDNKELWVGAGGSVMTKINTVKSVNTQTGDIVLTTDQITQGSTNKYYSSNLAKTDAGAALVNGNSGNSGVTFSYNSGSGTINAVVTNSGGLSTVSGDLSPALGGNLSLNSYNITGTGNVNTTGGITVSGSIATANLTLNGNTITSSALGGASNNPLIRLGILAPSTSGQGTTVAINQAGANPTLYVKNITSNSFGGISRIQFDGLKTSFASPALPALGDYIGGMSFGALNLAGATLDIGLIVGQVDPNGAIDATLADGKLVFLASGRNGASQAIRQMTFDSLGRLAVNQQNAVATLDVAGTIRASGYTVATLPTGTVGMMAYVTDATSPTYLGTLTGGGAVKVPVFYNGTAWVSH